MGVLVIVGVFVGVRLSSEVGLILLVCVIVAVILLVAGNEPVGKAVTVTDLVAGLVGVRVEVLCGDLLTFGVLLILKVGVIDALLEMDEVGDGDGSM